MNARADLLVREGERRATVVTVSNQISRRTPRPWQPGMLPRPWNGEISDEVSVHAPPRLGQ
jgi:hypothetical protein